MGAFVKNRLIFVLMGCLGIISLFINTNHVMLKGILPYDGSPRQTITIVSPSKKDADRFTFEDISLSDVFNRSLPCNKKPKCRPSVHTKVILLTYMRSGSTLTGDILSAHPGVFYVFEPLHSVAQANNTLFDFLRRRKVFVGNRKVYMKHNTITGFLNCDFERVDIDTLTQFHMKNSRQTKPYLKCLRDNPGTFGLIHCLPSLYKTCYKADVTLIKTITLSMRLAGSIAIQNPDVKIIHLVRDPRATIWSEGRYGIYNAKGFRKYVHMFCDKLLRDLQILKQIKARFPKRAMLMLYEKLADDPVEATRYLYYFINLPMTRNVTAHVRNITMSGHEEDCPLCISKADSAKTSQEWRLRINYNAARYIDSVCSPVYRYLGYQRVDNEDDFRNISLPLHSWPRL